MKKIVFTFLFISYGLTAYNQTISGTIMDKQTKEKLVFAAVYIAVHLSALIRTLMGILF